MVIRCAAIDDEPLALEKISDFIQKVPFLELKKTFDSALKAIDYLQNETIDLIFLDIQMDYLNGIQFLKNIKPDAKVIITTAYEEHALVGYELEVLDYLLKPYTFERFLNAVNKAYLLLEIKSEAKNNKHSMQVSKSEFFFVKTEHKLKKIQISDILYIKSLSNYLQIVMINEKVMTLQNFEQISTQLPDINFSRIHKSYIVAIDKIESIENNRVIINKEHIPITNSYRDSFLEKINNLGK